MGEAVEPPAVTRFGQSNIDGSSPVIDLVAQDDLPPAEKLETEDDWDYPYPTDFVIQEKPIDDHKSLKVSMQLGQNMIRHLLTVAGSRGWSWNCWHHCWCLAANQSTRHSIDYI